MFNKKKYLFGALIICFCIISISLLAQDKTFNYAPPPNFSILDTASGDFNADNYLDYIVILKNDSENDMPDTTRPLIILMGNKEHQLNQIARNDSVVLCKSCGGVFGDPYQGITIKNNYFSIDHYGGSAWRWTRHITFKFNKLKNEFILHKDGGESFHATDPDTSESFLRNKADFGKLPFKKYSYDKYTEK